MSFNISVWSRAWLQSYQHTACPDTGFQHFSSSCPHLSSTVPSGHPCPPSVTPSLTHHTQSNASPLLLPSSSLCYRSNCISWGGEEYESPHYLICFLFRFYILHLRADFRHLPHLPVSPTLLILRTDIASSADGYFPRNRFHLPLALSLKFITDTASCLHLAAAE